MGKTLLFLCLLAWAPSALSLNIVEHYQRCPDLHYVFTYDSSREESAYFQLRDQLEAVMQEAGAFALFRYAGDVGYEVDIDAFQEEFPGIGLYRWGMQANRTCTLGYDVDRVRINLEARLIRAKASMSIEEFCRFYTALAQDLGFDIYLKRR